MDHRSSYEYLLAIAGFDTKQKAKITSFDFKPQSNHQLIFLIMTKAVILAAGLAQRLKPITNYTPKSLLKIGNKTILGMTLESLSENQISEIVIVVGFEAAQIQQYVRKNYPQLSIEFVYNAEYEFTNNAYSLLLTQKALEGHSLLLLDGDIVFDSLILKKLLLCEEENTLAFNKAHKNFLTSEEIKVRLTQDNYIIEISKDIKPILATGESVGIHRFSEPTTHMLYHILHQQIHQQHQMDEFYESAFEELIHQGEKIYAMDIAPYNSMEIDTEADWHAANKFVNIHIS
ncbi:MAG TPA: nucleotidyl transferase [Bacteroidales bacterium]|nr:nucleotidyl transferase [Bacteroidales bacterium]